jgi:hypothetical protein
MYMLTDPAGTQLTQKREVAAWPGEKALWPGEVAMWPEEMVLWPG